jgi:hypothetical protein
MLQKFKIIPCAFILCLFGLTLITVSPGYAYDDLSGASDKFMNCQNIQIIGRKTESTREKMKCFRNLARTLELKLYKGKRSRGDENLDDAVRSNRMRSEREEPAADPVLPESETTETVSSSDQSDYQRRQRQCEQIWRELQDDKRVCEHGGRGGMGFGFLPHRDTLLACNRVTMLYPEQLRAAGCEN